MLLQFNLGLSHFFFAAEFSLQMLKESCRVIFLWELQVSIAL